MYEVFFEERKLIPPGCYHEMAFEDLEKDPMKEMRKAYAALDLPDFRAAETEMRGYLAGLQGYRKNRFPDLQPEIQARIRSTWTSTLAEWGYGRPQHPPAERARGGPWSAVSNPIQPCGQV